MSVIADIDTSQSRGFFRPFSRYSDTSGYLGSAPIYAYAPFLCTFCSLYHPAFGCRSPVPSRGTNALRALAACPSHDNCDSLTAGVAESRVRLTEAAESLVPSSSSTAHKAFTHINVPLRCVALVALLYAGNREVDAMLRDWATWDVLQVAMNFRIIVQAVLRTLSEDNMIREGSTHLLETIFTHDVIATAMSVALLVRGHCEELCLGREYRSPQGVLNCLQDLLEHSPSLSRRVKNRLVHAAIRLSKVFDIAPERLVLKNHLELRGKDPVASGSFGEVYRGVLNSEEVSIKMVKVYQRGGSSASKEFTKEALIWRQLNHPNVLPFYGVYYWDDSHSRLCLVSPWMAQGNVVDYLRKDLPLTNRVALAYDIANGLAYLHEENIIHGDLKGVNILVSHSGNACIGDFGLASVSLGDVASMPNYESSNSSSCQGTTRWLAPEVFETGVISAKSDIYAFACVLYELFSGCPPFAHIRLDATVMCKVAFLQERPTRPSSLALSDAVWALITQCWAQDPTARPTAQYALMALRAEFAVTPTAATWDASIPSKIRAALEELPFCPTVDSIQLLTGSMSRRVVPAIQKEEISTAAFRDNEATVKIPRLGPTNASSRHHIVSNPQGPKERTKSATSGHRATTPSLYGAARPRSSTMSARAPTSVPRAPAYVHRSLERSHSAPWPAETRQSRSVFARPCVRTPSISSISSVSPPAPFSATPWESRSGARRESQFELDWDEGDTLWSEEGCQQTSWDKCSISSSRPTSPALSATSTCIDSPSTHFEGHSFPETQLNPKAAVFVPRAMPWWSE